MKMKFLQFRLEWMRVGYVHILLNVNDIHFFFTLSLSDWLKNKIKVMKNLLEIFFFIKIFQYSHLSFNKKTYIIVLLLFSLFSPCHCILLCNDSKLFSISSFSMETMHFGRCQYLLTKYSLQ